MARLVVPPRKRHASISSESSSTSASSRIVVKKPSESVSRLASTRSVSTGTVGKARLVEIQPSHNTRPRRSTRLSTSNPGDDNVSTERPSSRNISGETLVPTDITVDQTERQLLNKGINALDMNWDVGKLVDPSKGEPSSGNLQKRKSSRLSMLTKAVTNTASILGKRSREVIESGKDKIQSIKENRRNSLRPRSTEETPVEDDGPPRKKSKLSITSAPNLFTITETRVELKPQPKPKKKWLQSGMYAGQARTFNPRLTETKNRMLQSRNIENPAKERKLLPLPMFKGEQLLESGRPFNLPFDIYSPLPPGQPRPEDWKKTGSNRFVGDAASFWKQHKPLAASKCLCSQEEGCGESCLNRYMLYECDESNCAIGAQHCTNRAFADLKERCKEIKKYTIDISDLQERRKEGGELEVMSDDLDERYKEGKKYRIGVEVVKTAQKGFGVRACRTFEANQIIIEYAGEIITQDECMRRMKEEYKNNECYYLMTFDQNMIVDATRGSIARFINHSCEPNCRMVKWTVAGKPRMALFAGDHGIMTGDELTYDYNFDPFSHKNAQTCHCGTASCRGVLGPRVSKDKDKEEKKAHQPSAVLAGTKRKLQQMVDDTSDMIKRRTSTQAKKRRATFDGVTSLTIQSKAQKRVASSASTLVEKENIAPSSRFHDGSSRTSSTESRFRAVKRPSPPAKGRRNTIGALSRAASSLKRNASALRTKTSLKRPSRFSVLATSRAAPLEPLTLEFTDNTPVKTGGSGRKPAKVTIAALKGRVESFKSPSIRSAPNTIRKNVVSSVKGQRRADAVKRLGLGGKGKITKSMRVVDDEE